MPTKKRRGREKAKRQSMELMDNPPAHVRSRIGQAGLLAENLETKLYNGGISKFNDHGQPVHLQQDKELGANSDRHERKILGYFPSASILI